MTKEIQKLKKKLLLEELKRQGKAPKQRLWIFLGLIMVALVAAGAYWYQANLQTRLEERFQQGLTLRQETRYSEAVEMFKELHTEQPSFVRIPQALFQIAEIQDLYLGRYSDALLTYLMLERDYPDAPEVFAARKQVAVLYKYRLNDCGQAIAVYQKVLDDADGNSDQLQYEVADCYFRLNNFAQARIEFESLLKNDPQSDLFAEVQYRIAMTYALEGKLPEAAGAYRVVIERWSESSYAVEASFGLATVLEEQEELVEALKILEELKGLYPKEDILTRKTEQVRERIEKKKKAI
jgi:TolA-binding protein